jgi:hypothetical protein
VWLGEGDLRYLVTKTGSIGTGGKPLSDSEYGSDAPFDPKIIARFAALFDGLSGTVSGYPMIALAVCAKIQFALREILSREGAFAADDYTTTLRDVVAMARETVRFAQAGKL